MNPGGGKVSLGHDHGSMSLEEGLNEADHSEHQPMESEQQVSKAQSEFKIQLQDVYNSYIIMSEALVASDPNEAEKAATQVESSLKDVDMSLLEGDAHILWMKHLKELESEIKTISTSSDISTQRIAFAAFNDAFYASLKAFGLEQGTVYYQYCPMANGDKGAYWLSNIKEIENPYFGDEMLRCGETREVLDFNEK
jgi:Cu(I)/Ag(I) efflux system membrane fusion protein